MKPKLAAVALVAIVAASEFRAVSAQGKTQWDGIFTAAQAARGATVYNDTCVPCHGPDLGGSDLAPSLTGADFAMNWNNMSAAELFDRVSMTMPLTAPGSLTAQQYADVLAFVLQKNGAPAGAAELPATKDVLAAVKLTAKTPASGAAPAPSGTVSAPSAAVSAGKTQWDGIFTAAQAVRGSTVYSDNCVACHGPDLGGSDLAPSLTGGDFATNWNDMNVAELFDRVSMTMPLTAPGSLTAQQYADVVAFVLQKNGAPAGAEEMPAKKELLSAVKFTAKKPGV